MRLDVFAAVSYDVVRTVVAAGAGVLALLGLRAWFRDGPGGLDGVVGALVILLVPVVGPAAYLLSRRGRRRSDPDEVALPRRPGGPVDSRPPRVGGPG